MTVRGESRGHCGRSCLSLYIVGSADQMPKTLLVLDFTLQHAAISKFHAARRTLEAVHSLHVVLDILLYRTT